jgi:acetyl-CoA carboxylase alpha subunit
MANKLKLALVEELEQLRSMPTPEVVLQRQNKFRQIGEFKQ